MAVAELALGEAELLLVVAFGASAFIGSVEADGGEEADGGVALGLGLEGADGDCAKADDSINPLSAVVINNF